jgi:hypothetical protein
LANGNFVAVFQNEVNANLADHDIFFTIRTATGATVAPALFVAGANDSPGDEVLPHVAALADGGFVVTWADSLGDQNGTSTGIRASIYDADGGLVQGNILANLLNQGGTQLFNDVTALPDGGFIVAWEDSSADVDRAQRFDAAGNLVGTPFVFSDHATGNINAATYSDGRAILTINDFFSVPSNTNVASSIWDSRPNDANQVTGANFFGPGGGSGDLLLIAAHSGVQTMEALQIENGNLQTAKVIGAVGSNIAFDGAGDFNRDGLSDLLAHTDTGAVRSLLAFHMTPEGVGGASTIGNLGIDWVADAFGDFNHDTTTDILLHQDSGGTRTFEALSINDYAVQSAAIVQVAGADWNVDGTGDFNHDGTSDILEHRVVGASMNVQVVTLNNNVVQSVSLLGTIGSDWQIDGMGDFNHDGTSDILMHRDTGTIRTAEILTINNNTVVSGTVVAQIGANFQIDGIGDFNHDGTSDIAMHADTGVIRNDWIFSVVDDVVTNAHIVGTTGNDWRVMGDSSQATQLVQAMAAFGSGSDGVDSLNTSPLGADTSQQPLLATPHT